MRPRTFILLLVVLLLLAAAVVLFLVVGGNLNIAGLLANGPTAPAGQDGTGGTGDSAQPGAQATPTARFVPVVVTRIDVPIGARLSEEFLEIEMRPESNIAVQADYTFGSIEEVTDQIVRAPIAKGQAILKSMIALGPTDMASIGSDLALYVNQGQVAIAVPIDRFSGAAFATRPGDLIDVMMGLNFVKIDEEFQTALPNLDMRVNLAQLGEGGGDFLLEEIAEGRLEVIPVGNTQQVVTLGPRGQLSWEFGELLQIPRRVTQLTIQQAEVLWIGTWQIPGQPPVSQPEPEEGPGGPVAGAPTAGRGAGGQQGGQSGAAGQQNNQSNPLGQVAGQADAPSVAPTPEADFAPREARPDMIILSVTPQDALALKWAMDRGVELDLALRAQGDTSVFATTAVSLPQMVEQGGLTIPERDTNDLDPRADEVIIPELPPLPPQAGGPQQTEQQEQ